MKWRQFVKVWSSDEGGWPYYCQWAVWCWRKPIWVGLPLVWLSIPLMIVDVVYGVVCLIVNWAKHR